ncbi:MAG TPA: xanthine dehydrogenase family protein molybdopterin-binding subunit [Gemmatimonadales bacterium]|nr:xanthine dehydrogenase family protein molybdopterin-binding subunit [Gemmatimonadales bacterium]
MSTQLTRRDFVETTAGLVIAFSIGPSARSGTRAPAKGPFAPNAWIRIDTDGIVTLTLDRSEMGQGSQTGLAMLLAEELEADWSTVRLGPMPENPAGWSRTMRTGGSHAIEGSWEPLRKAGAAAREMLVRAAAENWGVDKAECHAEKGAVVHASSGRRVAYGRLVTRAAALPVPTDVPLKDPKDFQLLGTRVHRIDTPSKVDGSAVFGIDVKVPGMLIASVERSPVLGGKVKKVNGDWAKQLPGVRHVVELEASSWMAPPAGGGWAAGCAAGVAVVADTYWQAVVARRALQIDWDEGNAASLDSASVRAQLAELGERPAIVAETVGDANAALASAAKRIDAVYDVPFIHHATMEPMNCTAHVQADGVEVWAPTQNQGDAQKVAAQISGFPAEKVRIHTTLSGGGFGRRLEPDFVSEAVRISKAVGAPVKVIWSREDDMRNGFYRPTSYNRLAAGLDASGRPVAWTHRIAGTPLRLKFGPLEKGIDDSLIDGAVMLPYAIPNVQIEQATLELAPVPRGPWRSVGVSHNGFVTECFFDEIAAAGGRDPVELRRGLLQNKPRHLRAMNVAAEKSGWGSPLPTGHGRGIALAEWGPTVCVEVAEVVVDADGTVHVPRVTCAVDCGPAVNPGQIEQQMLGGIVFGLSAALYGEITLAGGRVVQGNFDTYPVVRMPEAPVVEVHIVPSTDKIGGTGEPGVPPIAPAVCNAIFAATGKRVRRLPIGKVVV